MAFSILATGVAGRTATGGTAGHSGVVPSDSSGIVYYIRPDGGSPIQCTGRINAPYPGSGTGQPCAWDHPFRALPPGGTPRLTGGDTIVVGRGSYKMGYGAPGASNCDLAGSYNCLMPPIPSGPDAAHPTRILGVGWDSGCGQPPELWGSGRPWFIVNLTDASNVELACFEITDHSSCVEDHSGNLACNRNTPPYGDWASYGLYAEDSVNVRLRDLDIHGLATGGVHAGRLKDWTVEKVRIAGNGLVGWDGDLWDDNGDSNTGILTFRHWVVEWNGCGETYPGGKPVGCWGQEAGGYGDGVGTGATGGNWVIEDSVIRHNTSDGLDLLYHTLGGSIILNRVRSEGNAGNQVKVTGQTQIANSVLVGNCAFFENQPFTYWVDHCRALGNALELVFTGGEQVSIVNSTIYGQGDGLIGGGPREGFGCDGTEMISARNNIFLGDKDYFDPSDITFLFYQEGCANLKLHSDYNVIHQAKNVTCGAADTYTISGAHDLCLDPQLNGPFFGTVFGMTPGFGSPAIDSGNADICAAALVNNLDQLNKPRPKDGDGDDSAICDRGALEVQGGLKLSAFHSQATYDGWVLESGETSNIGGSLDAGAATFNLGDDALRRQFRAILSFHTGAALPDNAVITKVTLQIKKQGLTGGGNPFAIFQGLMVDLKNGFFGSAAELQKGDFQAAAGRTYGPFNPAAGGWYSINLTDAKNFINKFSTTSGLTQLRLRFKVDDNNNAVANYLSFYSGNCATAAFRPKLIIEYYNP